MKHELTTAGCPAQNLLEGDVYVDTFERMAMLASGGFTKPETVEELRVVLSVKPDPHHPGNVAVRSCKYRDGDKYRHAGYGRHGTYPADRMFTIILELNEER